MNGRPFGAWLEVTCTTCLTFTGGGAEARRRARAPSPSTAARAATARSIRRRLPALPVLTDTAVAHRAARRRDRYGAGRHRLATRGGVAAEPLQIGLEVPRCLVADVLVLLERLADDPFQLLGHPGIRLRGGRRIAVQDPVEHDTGRRPGEGLASRRHLVEHDPQAEEVRPRVERLAPHLLGGHVGDRTHHRPRGRELEPGPPSVSPRSPTRRAGGSAWRGRSPGASPAREASPTRSPASGRGGRRPCRARRRGHPPSGCRDPEGPRARSVARRSARAASAPRAAPSR